MNRKPVGDDVRSRLSPRTRSAFKRTLLHCVRGAGQLLLRHCAHVTQVRTKESQSSVVCAADLASEKFILEQLLSEFPKHNIITEESGRIWNHSEFTWVIDPLDGTSNFVAGLPWFGVQIALLRGPDPLLAAMYLPVERALYFAMAGGGAWRNGKRIRVTPEKDLSKLLCAFAFDSAPGKRDRLSMDLLFRVSRLVRNIRATNSLVDFCYTADGRLGACINLKTKIWDIAPIALLLPEAGGKFTLLNGNDLDLRLDENASKMEYAVLGAGESLYAPLHVAISKAFRQPASWCFLRKLERRPNGRLRHASG